MDRENKENKGTMTGSDMHRGATRPTQERSGMTEVERHVVVVAAPADEVSGEAEWPAASWESEAGRSRYGRSNSNRLGSWSPSLSGQSFGDIFDGLRDFGRRHPVALIGSAVFAGLLFGLYARSGRQGPSEYYGSHPDEIGDAMGRASSRYVPSSGSSRWRGSRPSRYYGRHQDEIGEAMGQASSQPAGSMRQGERGGATPSQYGSPHQDDSRRPMASGSNTGVGGPL